MRIQTKTIIIFLAISLVPLAIIGWVSYKKGEDALKKTLGLSYQQIADETMDKVDRSLYEVYHNIQTWTELELMQEVITDDMDGKISSFLIGLSKEYGYFSSIDALNSEGYVVASSSPEIVGQIFNQESFYVNSVTGKLYVEDVHLDKISKVWVVTFSFPILARFEDGKIIGVLCGKWRVDELFRMTQLKESKEEYYGKIILMRGDGLVISAPFSEKGNIFKYNLLTTGLKSALFAAGRKRGYLLEGDKNNKKSLIGYDYSKGSRDFSGLGWSILVIQDEKNAFAPIVRLKFIIFAMVIMVAAFVVFISLIVSRRMTAPILKISQVATRVAHGDFDQKIDYFSDDEIGSLVKTFNKMIQDLKKQSAQLVDKDYLDSIIANMVGSLIIVNSAGIIKNVNNATLELLGYEREKELIDRSVEDIFLDKEAIPRNGELIRMEMVKNFETNYKTKDRKGIPMLLSTALMKNKEGEITNIIFAAVDITDLKDAEEEKEKLHAQLLHSQKMEAIGTLSGGVAHDFNNILTVIMGHASLMEKGMKEDDRLRNDIKGILEASEKAGSLVQSLLTFSRKQITMLKTVNLNEIVEKVEKLLLRIIGENIEFKTILADADLTVIADSGQIEQVLMNLATNARDAMPDGGRLTIKTELIELDNEFIRVHGYGRPGMCSLISVADTGIGMDEKIKERIFEPFFTTKEVGKGTGLGLSIVYGIIKQHNGYINVYSEPGKGTAFKIYLPLGKSGAAEKEITITYSPERGSETILVAEDNVEIRRLVRRVLEEFNYNVIDAVDGEDAVKVFDKNRDEIRLLLFDVIMPKKGGVEAYKEIRKINPDIKALFTTGYSPDYRKDIIEDGLDFVSKPVSPNELLRKVREVLDK